MTRNRAFEVLVLGSLFVLPIVSGSVAYLYSVGILEAAGSGLAPRQALLQSHLWTKFSVEGGLFGLVVLATTVLVARGELSIPRPRCFLPFVGLLLVAQFLMVVRSPLVVLAGLRVFLPMAFVVLAYSALNRRSLRRLETVLVGLGVVAAVAGFIQLLVTGKQIGGTYGVYSLFSFPGTYAIFLLTVLAFVLSRREMDGATLGLIVLFVAAVVTSRSGTGLLGLALLFGLVLYRRFGNRMLVVSLSALPIAAPLVPLVSGRGLSVVSSALYRAEILLATLDRMTLVEFLFGWGLGSGTNLSVTLSRMGLVDGVYVFIADSLYVSLLAQVGVVGLALFLAFNFHLLARAWTDDGRAAAVLRYLIPVVLFAGGTQVVLESFPVIWVYWLVVGLYLGEHTGASLPEKSADRKPTIRDNGTSVDG